MISTAFAAAGAEGRSALIPYVTAGFPERGSTVEVMEALADRGADVIELGIPFSDPLADGPTIQNSSFVSLEGGTTVHGVLDDLRVLTPYSIELVIAIHAELLATIDRYYPLPGVNYGEGPVSRAL